MIEFAPISTKMSLLDAVLYCRFLDINGKRGWRIPTSQEMLSVENPMASRWSSWCSEDLTTVEFWEQSRCYVVPVRDI